MLERGGVVALPTDTIYGIACSTQCTEAIQRIYSIKGRQAAKPLAICVGGALDVDRLNTLTSSFANDHYVVWVGLNFHSNAEMCRHCEQNFFDKDCLHNNLSAVCMYHTCCILSGALLIYTPVRQLSH